MELMAKPSLKIVVTTAHKRPDLPEYDEQVRCPEHPGVVSMHGLYGAAGGGLGIYTVCRKCGRVLSKTEDR
jgi:hypothetical protein